MSIKTFTLDLLELDKTETNKHIKKIYKEIKGTITHITEKNFFKLIHTENDITKKVKVYQKGNEIIGFTSWRVERVFIDGQGYDIHRSLNVIKNGHRNLSSEKFLLLEILKYNIKNLFQRYRSIFVCRSDGPVTYYVFNKYFRNVYPSPDGVQNTKLENFAYRVAEKLSIQINNHNPIRTVSPFKVNDKPEDKNRWLARNDKSVKFYLNHCPNYLKDEDTDDTHSLFIIFKCDLDNLSSSIFRLLKSRGKSWLAGKDSIQLFDFLKFKLFSINRLIKFDSLLITLQIITVF